jgi:hypothetical protein
MPTQEEATEQLQSAITSMVLAADEQVRNIIESIFWGVVFSQR